MLVDEISSAYSLYGTNQATQAQSQTAKVQQAVADAKDDNDDVAASYVSGMTASVSGLTSSGDYSDIAMKIKSASMAAKTSNTTQYGTVTDSASLSGAAASGAASGSGAGASGGAAKAGGGAGAAGGAGGGGAVSGTSSDSEDDEDDEEDTTTEIVIINGQRYLKTTTTDEDGNETETLTPLGAGAKDQKQTASEN